MTTLRERWNRFKASLSGKAIWRWLKKSRLIKTLKNYIWWDDVIAILLLGLGVFYYWANIPENPSLKWQLIYQDMFADMIGIGITVLILGNFDQYLRIQSEKKRLILQMGSPDKGFAIEAVRQLRQNGWLVDGTTKGADLSGAQLEEADLSEAHLEGANLLEAHLERSILVEAHLEGANMGLAHLEGAFLLGAHLEGANMGHAHLDKAPLLGAHLEGANLTCAKTEKAFLIGATYNNQTRWPDGINPEEADAKLIDPTISLPLKR